MEPSFAFDLEKAKANFEKKKAKKLQKQLNKSKMISFQKSPKTTKSKKI